MESYLVTGGYGFIGTHLVKRLLTLGNTVLVIDNLSQGEVSLQHENLEFIEADIANPDLLREALSKVNYCIHLAAIASVSRCDMDYLNTHHHNYLPLVMIFECIRRHELPVSVIYASSAAVYGQIKDTPLLSESLYPHPQSLYGASKLACENLAHAVLHSHHIPSIGLRFFNVYGPGQKMDNDCAGVISLFAERIRHHLPLTVYGTGRQTRDFIFIDDVVNAILCSIDKVSRSPGIYNICTNQATSINQLVSKLMHCYDHRVQVSHKPKRNFDVQHSLGDSHKAEELLAFKAQTPLIQGLEQTIKPIGPSSEENPLQGKAR